MSINPVLPPPSRVAVDGSPHAVLSGVSRVAVIDAMRSAQRPLPVTELAELVGLHCNTVRWHLDQLARSGWVERVAESVGRPGRPRLLYALRPSVDDAPPDDNDRPEHGYRLLADILAGYLSETQPDAAAAAAAAGRAWGSYLVAKPAPFTRPNAAEATRRVVELLADLGFSPEADDDSGGIALHTCPFHEVAQAHPDVACSVHLGLMQGALVELGMGDMAVRLEPFSTPRTCRAHLGTEIFEPADETCEGEVATS